MSSTSRRRPRHRRRDRLDRRSRSPPTGDRLVPLGWRIPGAMSFASAPGAWPSSDIWRKLARVSSVSGGSITAAVLGLKWGPPRLPRARRPGPLPPPRWWMPIRRLAGKTIDEGGDPRRHLDARLDRRQSHGGLPQASVRPAPPCRPCRRDPPRFVINATNVQSRPPLFRFSATVHRRLRLRHDPELRAWSRPSPSPLPRPSRRCCRRYVSSSRRRPCTPSGQPHEDLASRALPDRGRAHRRRRLRQPRPRDCLEEVPDGPVATAAARARTRQSLRATGRATPIRINALIDNQVRSLRARARSSGRSTQATARAPTGASAPTLRTTAWPDPLPCPFDRTTALAETKTRLNRLDAALQERLINWGYAVCDAAMRRDCPAGSKAARNVSFLPQIGQFCQV